MVLVCWRLSHGLGEESEGDKCLCACEEEFCQV